MESQGTRSEFRSDVPHLGEGNKRIKHFKYLVKDTIRCRQAIGSNEFPDFIEVR
jgi:hypothetical protein